MARHIKHLDDGLISVEDNGILLAVTWLEPEQSSVTETTIIERKKCKSCERWQAQGFSACGAHENDLGFKAGVRWRDR